MIYKPSSSRMKEAIRGFWASTDSAGRKLSFALVIGLLVCCLLPAIILSAGVGLTSYFILHESDILTFSAIIIILLISCVIIWAFRHRSRSRGTQAEMDLGKDQQQSEGIGRAEEEQQTVRGGKIGKDHCCEGDSKSD
jgi:cbb3-type cytochrome oxidase subunit 3